MSLLLSSAKNTHPEEGDRRSGKIITFYSFKGGVGRTMALANVAFLAAASGSRCLVMDWDLEAPGLLHYFRGLLDVNEFRHLKEAPGILDLAWEWTSKVSSSSDPASVQAFIEKFDSGEPFVNVTERLVSERFLPSGACVDYIGSGGRLIHTPDARPYQEALVQFSWPNFMDIHGGGILLNALRDWAKANYDFIFIDSRTGYADVAGICTMQLPDIVALCFIFNRQNIEGIARVAGVIRQEREEAVEVRALPMRVARAGTPEDADARAKATTAFTRVGGFSPESLRRDFESLEILSADTVPFYETLAPFVAVNPRLDLLTLNYLASASALLGTDLQVPDLPPEVVELVRRRLQPSHATPDYLAKLTSTEPHQAGAELRMYLEAALESALSGDGDLDSDYASALIGASMSWNEMADSFEDASDIAGLTLDLIRALVPSNPTKWKPTLIAMLERYLDFFTHTMDAEEELALLDEVDALLAEANAANSRISRMEHRVRAATLHFEQASYPAAAQILQDIDGLLKATFRSEGLAPDQLARMFAVEGESRLLSADLELAEGNAQLAHERLSELLRFLTEKESAMLLASYRAISFRACLKMSDTLRVLQDPRGAAQYAIRAARVADSRLVASFPRLATAVVDSRDPASARALLHVLADGDHERRSRQFVQQFGRGFSKADQFLSPAAGLIALAASNGELSDQDRTAVANLGSTATLLVTFFASRPVPFAYRRRIAEVLSSAREVAEVLISVNVASEALLDATRRLDASAQRAVRPPPAR